MHSGPGKCNDMFYCKIDAEKLVCFWDTSIEVSQGSFTDQAMNGEVRMGKGLAKAYIIRDAAEGVPILTGNLLTCLLLDYI